MLVSSIARLNAISNMNNSAMGIMNSYSAMNSLVANSNSTFGGENNLSMLHELDKNLSLDLASNKLLYKISVLQDKALEKHNELDSCKPKPNSINYLA